MSAHSPGPWRYNSGSGRVEDANGHHVAELIVEEDGPLIAAAPELLAALKGIVNCLREDEGAAIAAAEALIARIEGDG